MVSTAQLRCLLLHHQYDYWYYNVDAVRFDDGRPRSGEYWMDGGMLFHDVCGVGDGGDHKCDSY